MHSWLGKNIEEIETLWGEADSVIYLGNGMRKYEYHLKDVDSSCYSFWFVDNEMKIVSYSYQGVCRPAG